MRLLGYVLLALICSAAVAAGSGRDRKPAPYALISGTVFRDSGLSLPGAEIIVAPEDASGKAGNYQKNKAVADSRGEFAIRVPAVPRRYSVSVRAPGFEPQEKSVTISGEDRVDVFFTLSAASK